jgi:proline iminopeptidase
MSIDTSSSISEGYVNSPEGELFYRARGLPARSALVCVHGGPGFTSYTMEPLLGLSDIVPVVRYDQAGCGRARRAGSRKVMSLEGFVEELEALRVALGLETMHLLGHSFGGVIIGEYALRDPARVESLIFSSVSIDIPRWVADGERLLGQLPLRERMILREGIRTGAWNSPAFVAALDLYYAKHVNGTTTISESLARSIEESDDQVYRTVWGPNELVVNGSIRNYSLVPRLQELRCPTLFMCGRFDEATPEAHAFFAEQVPGSRVHVFEHSAHNTFCNEEHEVVRVVGEFLRGL